MNTMIELRGVSKRFGEVVAVECIDLKVASGEFITLLGPSGCGKTTLLRILSGFESPSDGTIFIGGRDVTRLPPHRRNVNQVFQSYALFPHLTVRENIAFGLKMQRTPAEETKRRVAEAMAMVALTGLEDRRPAQLSGGQRQRVALARALVPRPDVLLLDEPLSALDAKLRRAVQLELKQLQRQLGLTFVFVTHDQEEALIMSDRIAVMNAGRIEQLGTPEEIYHRPRTAFVADFIGEANLLEAELIARDGSCARVRLKGGLELEVDGIGWPKLGGALVSIRPEKLLVSKQSLQLPNRFTARVVQEVFQGPLDRLVLVTASGTRLVALAANESAIREAVHEGEEVYVGVHPSDIVIVPAADRVTESVSP